MIRWCFAQFFSSSSLYIYIFFFSGNKNPWLLYFSFNLLHIWWNIFRRHIIITIFNIKGNECLRFLAYYFHQIYDSNRFNLRYFSWFLMYLFKFNINKVLNIFVLLDISLTIFHRFVLSTVSIINLLFFFLCLQLLTEHIYTNLYSR